MALTVNGSVVEESLVLAEMARLRPEYTAYVQSNGGQPSEEQLREWAEEDLIEATVFRQAAVATQPVPSEDRALQYLAENAEAYADLSPDDRLVKAREALQQRRLIKELRKGVSRPGEAEVRAYFEANPQMFMMPEILRLSHICRFVEPANKADVFLDLLRVKSELEGFRLNWVEAVEAYSDTFSRDRGIFNPVSRDDVPEALGDKLFSLKLGGVSDVIDMGRSLHLFRLLAREEPRRMAFEEVKEHLSGVLFEQACQDALHAKFDALKAASVIRREA